MLRKFTLINGGGLVACFTYQEKFISIFIHKKIHASKSHGRRQKSQIRENFSRTIICFPNLILYYKYLRASAKFYKNNFGSGSYEG